MSDALDLARLIREGDTIGWTTAAAEPLHLLGLMDAQLERMPRATAFISMGLADVPDAKRLAARMHVKALGGAGASRRFQDLGALDVVPGHYSSLPGLVARGEMTIDVVLAQLAPSGAGGFCSTLMLDHMQHAIPRARVVVAEVNDRAPEVEGDTSLAASDVDHVIHVSHAILEMKPRASGAIEKTIGETVARLIPDGATLQVGLGALPDGVLESLTGKRDLGLHTGTMGDRAMDLIDAGIITNRRKPIDTGLAVTAGVLGSERLYRWAHRNAALRLKSSAYTHDIGTLGQIPSLFGINTALEVDLTGQVNAEMAGNRHVGMVGGHADFARGCLRSKGGRGIVALESTAKGGTLSRIVPRLAGGVVTTSRSDVDVVVTEYGIAELRGRSVRERAQALVAIAHPNFRRDLAAAAESVL